MISLSEITIILGSVTRASRVKRILASEGVKSSVTKSASKDTGECPHGVRLNATDMYKAAMILRNQGIEYTVQNDIS